MASPCSFETTPYFIPSDLFDQFTQSKVQTYLLRVGDYILKCELSKNQVFGLFGLNDDYNI